MSAARRLALLTAASTLAVVLPAIPAVIGTAQAVAAQPVPGHTHLVPQVPRTNQPKISDGEIFDMAVIGTRIYVAGSFTGLANVGGAKVPQASLAAYDYNTGQILTTFRPTFDGSVTSVEASPDGTKLFVGGTFNTVNGVTSRKVASLNPTTGAPVASFKVTAVTNNPVSALAATNTTLYVGGRFTTINGVPRGSLAALNSTTGVVDPGFNLPITGGIGVNGGLTVQALKLTHDDSKLLVVHTGRQIAGQDRYGVGLIDTVTKTLLPWKTNLWQDNLPFVGGVQRVYAGDIAPNDQYFVVTSGSGGDRPPINDCAIAFPIAGGNNVQPLWVSRSFDSVYSVAVTEDAVYLGGHFQWEESPTSPQPWPGLDNVGYGTGQGLSGYGLGDAVVRRDHLGALDPATGTALEWDPGSNSFQGNKAMLATPRGLFAGGDATIQGGSSVGRVAFFDFNAETTSAVNTTITTPIEGRVVQSGVPFTITGTASAPSGMKRVQVEIYDRDSKQYLQDDQVSWGKSNNIYATLASPGATSTTWSLPMTLTGNHRYQIQAKAFGNTGSDPTKALKKIESFNLTDQTPATSITSPSTSLQSSLAFTLAGTATDDVGVNAVSLWFRDENNNYLQDNGSVAPTFNTFTARPDVIGAPNATWSYDVTLPHEGTWRASATAIDTAGQADLRSATRDYVVTTTGTAPSLSISAPAAVTAPLTVPAVQVAPGGHLTFSGTASDATAVQQVLVSLRNSSTHESLAADGTWGTSVIAGNYRISPLNLNSPTYNWAYTTPFTVAPGQYSFGVRAVNNLGLTTRGTLTVNVQVPGDAFPDTALSFTGTDQTPQTLHLNLAGTATDDKAVQAVRVSLYNNLTGQYVQSNGTLASSFSLFNATVAAPGTTSTGFTLGVDLPQAGDYSVTAYAEDSSGQRDPSSTGATARYLVFPGDANPTFDPTLGSPVSGTAFGQGRIVVTGRANDDVSMSKVEVAILNGTNQYMTSTGTFTPTETWNRAFLTSQGSPGSNFAYTSPVIPAGTYTVLERATDGYGKVGATLTVTNITVTLPANNPPVAHATVSCASNVCTFDGRTSTDEDATTLSYAWNFGNGTTGTGAVPVRTYTSPGTFTVTLTVTDEWGATSTTTLPVTITEPAGNVAPTPAFISSCAALACSVSGATTVDPNTGDVLTYTWNWGDGSPTSTGVTASHTYATTGTYTVTLTAADGWGKTATKTGPIVLVEPGGNTAPVPTFTTACSALTCSMNPSGTFDAQGDAIRYSWNFGDGTAASTLAAPSHTYAAGNTYTVTLTVTDGWNRSAATTRVVTVP
jgi:PKD repeat protein